MRNKTFKYVVYIFTFCVLISLTVCSKSKEENIKIGAILPLTGRFSSYGVEEKRGMELAIDKINENNGINGKKIKVIYEDSKGEDKIGVTLYNKLHSVDKVNLFFTSLTGISLAIKPLSVQNSTFQSCFAMTENIPKESKNVFRIYPSLEKEGQSITKFIKSQKVNEVAVLYYNSQAFNHLLNDVIKPDLENEDIKIRSDYFDSKSLSDLKNIIPRLVNKKSDILIITTYNDFVASVMKVIQELNIIGNIKIVGTLDFAVSYYLGNLKGIDLDNLISVIPKSIYYSQFDIEKKDNRLSFFEQYEAVYGKKVTYDAAYGYDAINILAEAISETKSTDVKKISDYLINREFKGVNGNIYIDSEGNSFTEWEYIKFEKGKVNIINVE